MIFICFTIVLFPDSPEPKEVEKRGEKKLDKELFTQKENLAFTFEAFLVLLYQLVDSI